MRLHIHHQTSYRYAKRVPFGPHCLLIRPKTGPHITVDQFAVRVSPAHQLRWMRDTRDNHVGLLELKESAEVLEIEMETFVDVAEENPFNFSIEPEASEYPFSYDADTQADLAGLTQTLYPRDVEALRTWLHPLWHPGRRRETVGLLQELNAVIYGRTKYQRREKRGVQSPAETLELGSGSCRDFATLFIEACRFLGLAARFVSGYMYHSEIDGRMSMHGWADVYLPGAGWIGFDPSWGILTNAQYVPTAVSRHPEHAPPISGTFFGFARDFLGTEVNLYVRRVGVDEPAEKATSPAEAPKATQTQLQTLRA
jgi:transglutaminase-like putative cysteine protease